MAGVMDFLGNLSGVGTALSIGSYLFGGFSAMGKRSLESV